MILSYRLCMAKANMLTRQESAALWVTGMSSSPLRFLAIL